MSDSKNVNNPPAGGQSELSEAHIAAAPSEVSSVAGSVPTSKAHARLSSSSDRQIKFERAQKCLENAALVSKRIKEHRKATAELLGRPFEDDEVGDTASEMASTMSERTGYSAATDVSTTLSVQDALNIPGISESLANTLKQKEILMERIKQYKEISKRPAKKTVKRETSIESSAGIRKARDNNNDLNQIINTLKEKENTLSVMQVKLRAMETTILDLQEKINEKDQIIEAKNKATTLMSDSLSKKDKESLHLLEDTKQQMIKMQENFINMESEWKAEKEVLVKQIHEKDDKITSLEEANTILENSRFEISVAHSKVLDELELKTKEITELQQKINNLSVPIEELSQKEKEDVEEEKGSLEIANMVELTKKIELLEQLNCQIRQTNKELENKLATTTTEAKSPTASPTKRASPLPTRKGGRNTAAKSKSPWSQLSESQEPEKKPTKGDAGKPDVVIQSLNKEILDKEYLISQKDAEIAELRVKHAEVEAAIKELKAREIASADTVDIGVWTETVEAPIEKPKHVENIEESESTELGANELLEKLKAAQEQITSLNEEIDASNKNMIKVKSSHKLKLKQMQKTIDNLSKVSDSNAEIVKLNEELHQLSQKVAELEEEKGNLQLHLVDYDSGRLTESDIYKKMVEMENLAEARLKAISVLEAQKFDLVQELHDLQQKSDEMEDKLADMSHLQSEQVCSEMKSVQLEEQIDQLVAGRKELELIIENLKLDKDQQEGNLKSLQDEKEELIHKLENYIQENMELTDKLEKLSAEKVSSAESIEIVESLTTLEKLELEEYNKELEGKLVDHSDTYKPPSPQECESIEKLMEQSADLNKRIELFTQEREEVMEKMHKISTENESLLDKISKINSECNSLQNNIQLLNNEKSELTALNDELNKQIEDLKRERIEIMKESVEISKPSSIDESSECAIADPQQDDKNTDKGNKAAKSVKQLTKEILKLKNTIKEREAEIGDCQMKILSLEEQQQKNNELIDSSKLYESKLKNLIDENKHLKEEIENTKKDAESASHLQALQQTQSLLQEYTATINARDARIFELEGLMGEYEKQIYNYSNTLQQKDKEMTEYINQITKLNDVSQKLKSTIELLEEEKAKDQNAELVKSLNKQISAYQKKLSELEEKLRAIEDDKTQLISLKVALESKNVTLDAELKKMQDAYTEKQNLIKELQVQHQKHNDDLSNVLAQVKERDEEIHEIKLQLRKESIENEKLRTSVSERESSTENFTKEIEETKEKLTQLSSENQQLREQYEAMETKNKELMDKLKKFAASVKKKSSMYAELEAQLIETQKQLEAKTQYIEQLAIQVDILPSLQEKLKLAEEELNRIQAQKLTIEQKKSQDVTNLQYEITNLGEKNAIAMNEIATLTATLNMLQNNLHVASDENEKLKSQIETLNNKLADHDLEQKNSANFVTKISNLEADINQKQQHVVDLLNKLESTEQQLSQLQFGHDAKVQERDLYIETLETEINKYKSRICRLEDSISAMEDRRHSLERKADQLDSQLREKQKSYAEYTSQEDHLVSRLAALMDHDRVVDKQLFEIEGENKELQNKIHYVNEENLRLRKSLGDIQEYCNTVVDKASKADFLESELTRTQNELKDLDAMFKRISQEHQTSISEKKQVIEELESEFNTQIENAIKEKKMLSEKYEKVIEHVNQLEHKLHKYQNGIETLKINNEELNRFNQELLEKSQASKEQVQAPDYTEQYINEINKLNSLVQSKTKELEDAYVKFEAFQTNNASVIYNYESRINDLQQQLQQTMVQADQLVQNMNMLQAENSQLQSILSQKDEDIKQLIERKTMTFEMNIPQTQGMIISSKIEPLSAPKSLDVSSIESQIVTDITPPQTGGKHEKVSEKKQTSRDPSTGVVEDVIVAKKAYLCYKGDETTSDQPEDLFNSDEGWGLGECEEVGEITPGLSHLNDQVLKLKADNDALKASLDASNAKLIKAMKKLKELKSNNEMLSNELRLSKQLSQSSFLDSAIEDEMKINIQVLEKKIEEVTAELTKEKRDKEYVKKQNDVLNNANEKLLEMKEKMDSEVELWKFKFKEVNDKMSTLQWDAKDSPVHKPKEPTKQKSDSKDVLLREEIAKLESENDELQSAIEQVTRQNKDLSSEQSKLKVEIDNLYKELQKHHASVGNHEVLNKQLSEMQSKVSELEKENEGLFIKMNSKVSELENENGSLMNKIKETDENLQIANELIEKERSLVQHLQEDLESKNKEWLESSNQMTNEIEALKKVDIEARNQLSVVIAELQEAKSKLIWHETQQQAPKSQEADFALNEKYSALEDTCAYMKQNLDEANAKLLQLESANNELTVKCQAYEDEVKALNEKLQHLNTENDQLLSTVAELRSSVSTAVDQRGYEIAELWKQHLAQREADFQKMEQELRTQLNASEVKYEQLLDNVQSSSQEETSKIVTMEQVASLQSKLQDKEDHLRNLQDKYAEVMSQIDVLRSDFEDERSIFENKLLTQQEEYEKQIQDITASNKQHSDGFEQSYKNLQQELATLKTSNDELNQQSQELITKVQELEAHVVDLSNQLRLKDSEVYQKTNDYSIALKQRNEEFENVRQQLLEYEKKIEDLSYEKESELAVLRLKMHEKQEYYDRTHTGYESERASLSEELNAKIVECTNLNRQISELNKSLEEHSANVSEMQTALESQEYEIVTLKDEVSSLKDALRSSSSKIEKHVTFSSDTKAGEANDDATDIGLNKELLDAVPRAELDLALYMLHQRDVRCEELTMELTQLLDERDTLQLRLSDSLRSYEDLKANYKAGLDTTLDTSQETVGELPSFVVEKEQGLADVHRGQTSRSSSISDPDGDRLHLQAKLSELRTVRHTRDVRLRSDSEQRQRGLRLLQRDVAALPPAALDQLAQAHHTLSRDSQSTPTVLLNWLRGKSTPKIVHDM